MADRGALQGQTYALPTVQPVAPAPAQQPFDDGVRAMEGLQVVKGQTEAYYRKVAALKSFMQDAHQNFGVDVRVPDLSKPESIKLHQIYNDAITDILHTGNELKQGATLDMMSRNRGDIYAPGVDPNAQSAATLRPQVDVWNKNFEPTITQVNDKLQMPSQTQEEQNQKEQIYKDTVAHYERLKAEHPEGAAYYDYQISGLTPPTKGDFRPFAPRTTWQEHAWGKKVAASGNLVKKITNLADGAHDSYTPDPNLLNAEGTPMMVSKEFYGQKIGDKIVDSWVFDPDTKDTVIKFRDGTTEPVSNQDPRTLTSQLTHTDPNAIEEWAAKNNVTDEYQQIDRSKLYGKDWQKLQERNIEKAKTTKVTTGPAVDEMKKDLAEMDNHFLPWVSNDTHDFGGVLIEKTSDGFEIKNINKLVPADKKGKEVQAWISRHKRYKDNDTDRQALANFLINRGAHIKNYKEKRKNSNVGTQVAPSTNNTQISPEEFNAKWSTLKSGEKLMGPDGIEYTKK